MSTNQAPADPARVRVADALSRLAVDTAELPAPVLARLTHRGRNPDARLVVGRYLIVGELGRGGMGVVYDAWDPGIERRVAIKTIEPELVAEEEREEVVARFRRETKIVGKLHHPAIVTIFDFGQERAVDPASGARSPSLLYYVMEYLEGQSLGQVLKRQGRLPDLDAVRIAADIAEALQLSHDAGVIHRDIKPSNIFLRNGTDAVLLDFGIAKTGKTTLTRQGQIMGTPSYLAPERLKEKVQPIDGRADIFSLGILLFTMLTGETPFVGDDVYEVIDKITRQDHPDIGRTTAAGRQLSEVLDRMLAKHPQDRYGRSADAAAALRSVEAALDPAAPSFAEDAPDALTAPAQPTPPPARPTPPPAERASPSFASLSGPATDLLEEVPPPREEATRIQPPPLPAAPAPILAVAPRARLDSDASAGTVSPAPSPGRAGPPTERVGTQPELLVHEVRRDPHGPPPLPRVENLDPPPPFPDLTRAKPVTPPAAPADGEDATEMGPKLRPGRAESTLEVPRALRKTAAPAPVLREPPRVRPRERIEAALIDESRVVHPEALDTRPDEAPTRSEDRPAPLSSPWAPREDGRARLFGTTADPAELPQVAISVRGLEPPDRANSAAVARRTIAAAPARASSNPPSVQVRMQGSGLGEDRGLLVKRRLLVLLAGGLASAAIGLLLGRMQHVPSRPAVTAAPPGPRARPAPMPDEPALVRPRTARELVAGADEALAKKRYADAAQMYTRALSMLSAGHALTAGARLGRAEALHELEQVPDALAEYRAIAREHPGTPEAERALDVLRSLGVRVKPPPRAPARAPAPPARPPAKAKAAPAPSGPPSGLSGAAACRWVKTNYLKDAAGAVRALEELRRDYPTEPCIFWNLGRKYESLKENRSALSAYQRFLMLAPDSPKAPAIQRRVSNLRGKLQLRP